ncbi:LysR family transcriptional regulator [Sphingobium sp. BYY-5]|uniref:LysR family transcriptional regulator n=1 Tax=Sphingobium sp. BYY-5 TaxID=2926400 RepID=UPI001FA73304|nr:LysR family transcriptional regulator [Sphingobium sp. BYY-5]MCI4591676.1 LysR family transcriptional regulator [Sphingobium sp. BYY-5]
MSRTDIADFTYFLAIARHRNFRLAGVQLGVSASAVSHALKGLEGRLGVRLLNRTNRSVTLTAAGEELHDAISQPFAAIGQAYERINAYRDAPAGKIRLNVIADAAQLVLAPVLPVFADRYPDVAVEITANDRMIDVIGSGFDAGIRHGGTVPEDMIARRISADLRWVVAASPAYLARFGRLRTPADLEAHRCLGVRLGNERMYRWEFMGPDGEFAIAVPSQVVAEDGRAMLALALNDFGLMYGTEAIFAPYLARGELELVLEDWSTTGPGYHIYYSSRRQVPMGLRLLIDLIQEFRPLGL